MFARARRIACRVLPLAALASIACAGSSEPAAEASGAGSEASSANANAGTAGAGGVGPVAGGAGLAGAGAGTGATLAGREAAGTTGGAGTGGGGSGSPPTSGAAFGRTASELVASLTLGWNLGNSLDAPEGESAWGNPPATGELLQAVADQGFDVVRIPVTWSLHMGAAPEYRIDAAWMARVEEVVRLAVERDLYAIINLHHDGADGYEGVEWITLNDASGAITQDNNRVVEERFGAVWRQIATHFADFGERLIFESMNEIHDGYDAPDPSYYEIVNRLNQVFVDTVRASGGNNAERYLLVPGYNTNIDYTIAGFTRPVDPAPERLILSVHYYDPWSFAGAGTTSSWGSQSPGNDGWGQEDYVREQFDKLARTYVMQGLPVILGEYGAVRQANGETYRRYYIEYVTKAAVDRGILPVYWDNGGKGTGQDAFALIDRTSHEVLAPVILEAMQRAASDSYALGDVQPP